MSQDTASSDSQSTSELGLNVHTQYIKDLSVENPNAPAIYMEMEQGPEVSVNLDVEGERLQERVYEVTLNASINAYVGEKTAFVVELKYAALISLDENVTDEQGETLVLIETPRYLFPFARNIIASAARDAGYPPLLINPVNFAQLYERQKARRQAQQETEA